MKKVYLVLLILTLLICGFAIMGQRYEIKSLEMEIDFILHPEGQLKAPPPKIAPKEATPIAPPAKTAPPPKKDYNSESMA